MRIFHSLYKILINVMVSHGQLSSKNQSKFTKSYPIQLMILPKSHLYSITNIN